MRKFLNFVIPVILLIAIIASIGWYLFIFDRDFTRDVLLQQARHSDLNGNAKLASLFYNLAYEHSGQDDSVAIELANQYKADGNYTKAEVTLSHAIADSASVELYIALSKTYVEQDKLLDAAQLLDMIDDPALKKELTALRPQAPVCSPEPGFFSQYISVSLESDDGTIYYSLDGEYPSVEDAPYSEPIALPEGETVIRTVCVSDAGLVSPVSILGYTIGGIIEQVSFTDAAMEEAIRALAGVDADQSLYTNDLWDIFEFEVPANAKSLEDIRFLPYLKKLTVSNMNLDTLNTLSPLKELEELSMTGCTFPEADMTVLASFADLQKLTLAECNLSTVANLTNAQNLTYLDLSGNTVRNLEPLASMTTLKELYLQHNAVTNLSDLSGLINLEILDVSFNSMISVAPIATCVNLRELNAGNNMLINLNGLDNLPALSVLNVEYNEITDLSILSGSTGLTELSISSNAIGDLSPLLNLTNLEILDFSYNQVEELPAWEAGALRIIDGSYNKVKSINVLGNMPDLAYVYMDYNELESVKAIEKCFHLVQVNVYGNKIPDEDIEALTEHGIIVNYTPL